MITKLNVVENKNLVINTKFLFLVDTYIHSIVLQYLQKLERKLYYLLILNFL